ncbi:hypothetical protein IAG44_26975 [Streptomyces roseirectus]|uniref:DUF559 domain-containing protein n=1 Tax=Streptomyces roseirectus TaxID=2768066 RepID=A0A7H0IIU4_9ACTN|nr:hypothetical protein [Streptomyces roseirectus]QNP72710.1 hypothetical protein IAG44_26975 [Streptomyces roseirectus]
MNSDTPLSQRSLFHADRDLVLTAAQLRAQGVSQAETNERCRPGGPWQQLLPGVYALHSCAVSGEERVRGALRYAARGNRGAGRGGQRGAGVREVAVPPQGATGGDAMITGLAALALHGFSAPPPLPDQEFVDVLVPRLRRLRSTGYVRIVRAASLPAPVLVNGVPVAPAARALADAVAELDDAGVVRRLMAEAVRDGHCEPAVAVRELSRAKLLSRPHVMDAVDALLAEGRALAENRLYRLVRDHALPDPLWNVDLRLPGGPHLGGLDAYWPDHAVALELDVRAPRQEDDVLWAEYARKRETLERLGITVVHITPRKLRESMEQQAMVIRTALLAAADRPPSAYVVVLPR